MKSYATRAACVLIVVCGFVATAANAEEESAVYESLDDIVIGRIFLSPAERSSLDERRGKEPPAVTPDMPGATSSNAKRVPDAAGYIMRSGGSSRVWSNGGFIPAGDVSRVTFPGDVEVYRKAARKPETNPGAADDASK